MSIKDKIFGAGKDKPPQSTDPFNNRLMRINRYIAKPKVLLILCIATTATIVLLGNYLLNIAGSALKSVFGKAEELWWNPLYALKFSPMSLVVLIVLALIVCVVMVIRIRFNWSEQNAGQKGTARWTTPKEIEEQYLKIPEKDGIFPGRGGLPVARKGNSIYIDQSLTHALILGTTRSGKGETFIIPMIDNYSRAEQKSSMVIADPKLELYAMCKDTLEARGYDVCLLNFCEPAKSMGFNPLAQIYEEYKAGKEDTAQQLCRSLALSIYDDDEVRASGAADFFIKGSVGVLSALILAMISDAIELDERTGGDKYGKQISLYSITTMFTALGTTILDPQTREYAIDRYFSDRPYDDIAKLLYMQANISGQETKGSILASMISELQVYQLGSTAKMTAESTINIRDIGYGNKPLAVFIGIPYEDSSNHVIATTFLRQISFTLTQAARKSTGGKNKRDVIFILDEFGNLPPIENLASLITAGIASGMMYVLAVQSYAQIEKKYGKDTATITGNCGNQVFILSGDKDTSDYFSEMLANATTTNISRSGDRLGFSKNITESYDERALLTGGELRQLTNGENVIVRVTTRTDLEANSVRPTPIFNYGAGAFKYRYKYLEDTFPNKDYIEIDFPSRENIDLKERTFNITPYIDIIKEGIPASVVDCLLGTVDTDTLGADTDTSYTFSSKKDYTLVSSLISKSKIKALLIKAGANLETEYFNDALTVTEAKELFVDLHKRGDIDDEDFAKAIKHLGSDKETIAKQQIKENEYVIA
jgi:Type IV secretory pathway, VirD4 components